MAFEIIELADELKTWADLYAKERENASMNKMKFDLILASRLPELRRIKSNAGIDILRLMLLEDLNEEVTGYYTAWQASEDKYKGIERILDAIQEKINVRKLIVKTEGSAV